jgi:hypothetical protein
MNACSIGGDLSKGFLTGGVSCGGNCTVQATILSRDANLQPALTGNLLICTGMPHHHDDKFGRKSINLFPERLRSPQSSWEKFKDGPIATREMNALYASEYNFASSRIDD